MTKTNIQPFSPPSTFMTKANIQPLSPPSTFIAEMLQPILLSPRNRKKQTLWTKDNPCAPLECHLRDKMCSSA